MSTLLPPPAPTYLSRLTSLLVTGGLPPPTLSLSTLTPVRLFSTSLVFFKSFPFLLPVLSIINAPHGRFALPSSILNLPGNWTWFLMEVWSPLLFALSFLSTVPLTDDLKLNSLSAWTSLLAPSFSKLSSLPPANIVLGSCFLIHYIHRAIIQPYRSPPRSPIHLSAALSATLFNAQNGFVMGSWLGGTSPDLTIPFDVLTNSNNNSGLSNKLGTALSRNLTISNPGLLPQGASTLLEPLFILGILGWAIGLIGNIWHDEVLMNIRKEAAKKGKGKGKGKGEDKEVEEDKKPKYGIPYGGLYEYISFPNYLCEWFEWFSLSLSSLSLLPSFASLPPLSRLSLFLGTAPPLIFPVVEVCAMLPRAINGHAWYRKRFEGVLDEGTGRRGYPEERRAVVPFLL